MPRSAGPIENNATAKMALVFFVLIVFLVAYIYRTSLRIPPDPRIQAAFSKAGAVGAYALTDETQAIVGDRRLVIRGKYLVDRPRNAYLSVSTTTVYQGPGRVGQSFTLSNVSIGDEVYSKMEVGGSAPETSIPSSSEWHHFKSDAIPEEYVGIAVSGPLLDSLRLFGEGGTYLHLVDKVADSQIEGTPTAQYRFTLSGKTPPSPGGTLEALLGHIGTGTVDAWITGDGTILQMALDGAGYRATSTFSRFDEALDIAAPVQQAVVE